MSRKYKRLSKELKEELELVNKQLAVVMDRLNGRAKVMSDKEFDRFVRDLKYPLCFDSINGKYFTEVQGDKIESIYTKYIDIISGGYLCLGALREKYIGEFQRLIQWHILHDDTTEIISDTFDHSAQLKAVQAQICDLQNKLNEARAAVSEMRMRRNQPTSL